MRILVAGTLSVSVMVWAMGIVSGQTIPTGSGQAYPYKPIRIVTSGLGGGSDFVARLVAYELSGALGQQVVVDNRASGVVPGQIVSRAPPDGYTLLVIGNSFWTAPLLLKTPYDPITDFSPVTLLVRAPSMLVVHPSLAANSVKELIALAKSKPGVLNYAAGSPGGAGHLTAELFKSMAEVDIVGIPYKANSVAMSALLAGKEVQLTFDNATALLPFVKSGKLKALAVTSAQPSALVPGVPTMAQTLPGFEAVSRNAMFAPARTPATTIDRLNQEVVRVLNKADVTERLLTIGVEAAGSSSKEFAAALKSETERLGTLIKKAGIKAE